MKLGSIPEKALTSYKRTSCLDPGREFEGAIAGDISALPNCIATGCYAALSRWDVVDTETLAEMP